MMAIGTPNGVAWSAIVLAVLVLAPASVTASRGASGAGTTATAAPACPARDKAVEACPADPCACEASGLTAQRTDPGAQAHATIPAGTSAHHLSGIEVIVVDNGTDKINSTGSDGKGGTTAHPSSDPKVFPGPGTGPVVLAVAAAAVLAYLSRRRGAPDPGATRTPHQDPDRSNGHQNGYHPGKRKDRR
jgi:hypothetical protein